MRKRVAICACGLTVPAVSTIIRKAILLTPQPACRTPAPLRLLTNSFPPPITLSHYGEPTVTPDMVCNHRPGYNNHHRHRRYLHHTRCHTHHLD